jgi:alpha-methylacyl-CoA racemase
MGPLTGIRVVELAGRGPGPFAGMMLADMGAEVIRIDRPGGDVRTEVPDARLELVGRGRRSVAVDLKNPAGAEVVLRLAGQADCLYEGFRPGVAERLGIGPDECLKRNPRLVYGRATGWGQDGPLAHAAGHDINYIALAGALWPIGRDDRTPPVIPLNLIGDYAGGGMLLAFGLLCGILEARESGQGQVVDAAMVDGASLLMTLFHGRRRNGTWKDVRGTNYIDGGAPYYNTYETSDGHYVSVGAIEPKFHRQLFATMGLDDIPHPVTRKDWPRVKERLTAEFRTRTRAEWVALLEGTDACFAPVLRLDEVVEHPHHAARDSFVDVSGVTQPAPAPRFSRTPPAVAAPPPAVGERGAEALADWGFSAAEVEEMRASGAVVLAQ